MKIGFVGLGNMGNGMVKNLLAKDFDVVGFDVDDSKYVDLKKSGLKKANTLEDISKKCEVVIICLANPSISEAVIFDSLLADDTKIHTIIETSTLTPVNVKDFANKIEENGKRFLSAPMIGGKNHATNGTIEFLVEGSKEVFKDCKSILDAMGSKTSFMGNVPSATLAKLAFNLSRYANIAVGVETHRLLIKYEANIPAIYKFMSKQSLDNFGQVWSEDLKEMMMTNEPFKPSKVPEKDLALLIGMAQSMSLDDSLIQKIRRTYLSMEKQ